jgi:ElaB/YqjD/DUF883 family membrane-anchored ribosome-binding protein
MANTKNEPGKPGADKQSGAADTGSAGKVSAGTSVGNIGEAPMPHAHDAKPAASQGSGATGSGATSAGQGASQSKGQTSGQSSQQNAQGQGGGSGGGSMADKAQQATEQVRQKAEDAYEGASEWARDTYERASGWASNSYGQQRRRSTRAFGNARGGMQSYVSENPMVVGIVGLAAGLLLGALLPRTRRENEMFGEWADEVRNQGLRYAREAASRGREYVEETFNGDEAQYSRHESEFGGGQRDANRH